MATMVYITTTPKRQGTATVRQFDTLIAARAEVMSMSDRHLTEAEVKEWRQGK